MADSALDKDLLEILCCPCCRGDLDHDAEHAELSCAACAHVYPVVDGIPVLLPVNVKERFEELFGRYWDSEDRAETYDHFVEGAEGMIGMHNHLGEMKASLEVLGDVSGLRLLDAGCGNGRLFEHLPDSTFTVGVDASLNLLRIVKEKGRCPRLVCCELEHLPFKDASFDRTISVRVLQHLVKQEQAVQEMVRVIETGGELILHLYNDWCTKAAVKRIRMSKRWQPIVNAPFERLHRSLSPFSPWPLDYDNYNTAPQVRRWLERAGARVQELRGAGFSFNKWFLSGFLISGRLERDHPEWLRRYFRWSKRAEEAVDRHAPFNAVMEKFVMRARKEASR